MKRTFTTVLTALYLLSSVGFASVQQYCNNAGKVMLTGEAQCCSEDAESMKAETPSCCSLMIDGPSLVQGEETWNDGCCVFQEVYQQVDGSPTPHQDKLTQDEKALVEFISNSQHFRATIPETLDVSSDPSTHLNTPLLI